MQTVQEFTLQNCKKTCIDDGRWTYIYEGVSIIEVTYWDDFARSWLVRVSDVDGQKQVRNVHDGWEFVGIVTDDAGEILINYYLNNPR